MFDRKNNFWGKIDFSNIFLEFSNFKIVGFVQIGTLNLLQ